MSREDAIKLEGVVVEALTERLYRIELPNGHRLLGHMPRGWSSRQRVPSPHKGAVENEKAWPGVERFAVGNKITVEMSPFDFSKGRISLNQS